MIMMVAPLQGYTDATYREAHHRLYDADAIYFTPFIRIEHGVPRQRDMHDLMLSAAEGAAITVPQVIFRDSCELSILLDALAAAVHRRVDLNLGCPFPMQTSKGRGAAMMCNYNELERIAVTISKYPDLIFSVKMRLGLDNRDQWRRAMDVINGIELSHVTMHARIARQQYGGAVDMESFNDFVTSSRNPVIYNGDLLIPSDIRLVADTVDGIAGVMLGRGLLGRPSIINEYVDGCDWDPMRRRAMMLKLHDEVLDRYTHKLCGDSQILAKIRPFWEYAEAEIGRKSWKALRKAGTLSRYMEAVAGVARG